MPCYSGRTFPATNPPSLPRPNGAGNAADSGNDSDLLVVISRHSEVQPSSASGGGRAGKRRRVEGADLRSLSGGTALTPNNKVAPSPQVGAAGLDFTALTSFIDSRIGQQGGYHILQPLVERTRLCILRDACVKQDYFYLVLHQLYWTISMGFKILDSVLKNNSGFPRSSLEWCANFPYQPADLSQSPTFSHVATFLICLATNWTALREEPFNRLCPYLMDEMVGKLKCYSVILQNILFTASRRRLGILDGHFGIAMDQWFCKDQQDHIVDGQFRVPLSSNHPDELERRNQDLVQRYKQIISAANAQSQGNGPRRQQQLFIQQKVQEYSPQQGDLQQSAFRPTWVEQQHSQIKQAYRAGETSFQTAYSSIPSSQQPTASPATAAQSHAINSPPFPYNRFSLPATGQMVHEPPAPVLRSSSPGSVPTSQMVQSMPSSQTYTQGGLDHQLCGFSKHCTPAQNLQSIQNMVFVHQAATQHQWPRESDLLTNQQKSTSPVARKPRVLHTAPRPRASHQVRANDPKFATGSHFPTMLVPRPDQAIERSDWPHCHQRKKSPMMSLHQARARSPDRTRRADEGAERHYQAVRSFAVKPFRLVTFHELELTVVPEIYSLLCKMRRMSLVSGQLSAPTVRECTNGSLRYRLRCCQTNAEKAITESDWVTKETSWPEHIFPHFNAAELVVRRDNHRKDLPVELTDFVVPGLNKLKVTSMQAGSNADNKQDLVSSQTVMQLS